MSPVEEITSENIILALEAAITVHSTNSSDIDYLYNYYRGDQPILDRIKTVRPEINNKIVENHALEIVDFKKGYEFGEQIQYVRRGKDESVSEKINQLNDFMFSANKVSQDAKLAEWFYISGTSFRMVLPKSDDLDETPFEIDVLDPRYTFVVYSSGFGNHPLMGVKSIKTLDDKVRYQIYTPKEYFEIEEEQIIKVEPHALGMIPIIEYPANPSRLGAFEIVLPLLDTLNNMASNRMDGIEQFVQSFMKFVNCDIDETSFQALKDMGAIKIKGEPGNPADVDIVSKELNQTQAQVSKDDLYQMVLIICGMPNRNGGSSTSDTGAAVILRDGWSAAESRAKATEVVYKESDKKFLKLVLRIVRDMVGLDLKLSDIDIKFNRRQNDNLLVKTQGLQNMLEAGVHPLVAITTCGLFNDATDVYSQSKEYLKKWEDKKPEKTLPSH